MPDFTPSQPEKEQISLYLPKAKLEIKNFTEYSFNSNFLTPTDGFSFTIGAERLSDEQKAAIVPGVPVQLILNGSVQATGFLDSKEVSASRGSGSVWRFEGRDSLAQVVDSCADPTVSLKEGQTLLDAVVALFSPFGWTAENQFLNSNEANRALKSHKFREKTKSSDAKGQGRKAIKQYKLHQLRPYPREGVFEFASRIAQRYGLWIWSTADGKQIVISTPDFDQDPIYELHRNLDGTTNVLEGSVKFDLADQPTHIVADTYTRGGEFGRGRAKVIYANTSVTLGDEVTPPDVTKYVQAGAKVLGGGTFPASALMFAPRARVLYLHDDESQTQEHLEAFVRREMALLQRKSLTVSYTVEGHGQNTPDGFIPWTVDTIVRVRDELAGVDEDLYVLGRTFNKSRSGGTTTHLELIRKHTLVFTDIGK